MLAQAGQNPSFPSSAKSMSEKMFIAIACLANLNFCKHLCKNRLSFYRDSLTKWRFLIEYLFYYIGDLDTAVLPYDFQHFLMIWWKNQIQFLLASIFLIYSKKYLEYPFQWPWSSNFFLFWTNPRQETLWLEKAPRKALWQMKIAIWTKSTIDRKHIFEECFSDDFKNKTVDS